ncbi:MAG: alpha-2-macroglobulin [Thermoanaerobaculia bacterium]|nr:alpha-2-macroglobulin [Thermoanaerobaculia bacterium]
MVVYATLCALFASAYVVVLASPAQGETSHALRPDDAAGTVVVPDDFLRRWDPVTIFFDRDLGPASDGGAETAPERYVELRPEHPGAWRWLDSRTLQFEPADPWPALARFTVAPKHGGSPARLATLMARPQQTIPEDGEEGLSSVETLTLTFAEPLDPESLARATTVELRALPGIDSQGARWLDREDFEVKVLERARRSDPASYVLRFREPLPLGQRVLVHQQLSLDPLPMAGSGDEARPSPGSQTPGRVTLVDFTTAEPFRVIAFGCRANRYPVTPGGSRYGSDRAIRCEDTEPAIQIDFSATLGSVDPLQARNLVRLSPAVPDVRSWTSERSLYLRGEFERDVLYTLRLEPAPAGHSRLSDARNRGLEMPGASEVHLVFPARAPYLHWTVGTGVVERLGPRMAPVEGRGDAALDLRLHEIDPLDRNLWPFSPAPLMVDEWRRPPGPGEMPPPITEPEQSPDEEHLRNWIRGLPAPPVSTLVDLPLRGGDTARFGLDLERHLESLSGADQPGSYLVGLRRLDGAAERSWLRLQVTDLALTTVEEGLRTVFVVTSLRTAEPVVGATVRVETSARRSQGSWHEEFRGLTDSTGRVEWAAPGHASDRRTVRRIVVTSGDDILVLDPERAPDRYYDGAFTDTGERWLQWALRNLSRRGPQRRNLLHLFTERPVYRPEEPVHLKGYLRQRYRGVLSIPENDSAAILIDGPGGRKWRLPVQVDQDTGSFYVRFPEADGKGGEGEKADTPSGVYRAHFEARIDGRRWSSQPISFRKEAYRLPRFEVQLRGPKNDRATLDAPFRIDLSATYYAGGRVTERPVRWRVTQFPYTWIPDLGSDVDDTQDIDLRGFVFSSDGRFSRTEAFRSTPALDKTDVTDSDGGAVLEIDPGIEPTAQPRTYVVEATVTGADDQTVTDSRRIVALPPFLLGLRAPRYLAPGERLQPEFVVVGPDETLLEGQEVTVRLLHRQWHSHLRASDFTDGVARYVTDVVDEEVFKISLTSSERATTVPLELPEPGVYVVEVESRDRLGRAQVVAIDLFAAGEGGQQIAWSKPKTQVFDMATDQAIYEPGQTARLVLQSPFQNARALVVVEAPEGNRYHWVQITGGQGVFELALDGSWAPRLAVHALLYRGRVEGTAPRPGNAVDLGKPTLLAATQWITVKPLAQTLQVGLDHPGESLPGREVDVEVSLAAPDGSPLPGEVTLWLVDRAVLALGQEQRLDPVPDFVPAESSHVAVRDTRGQVLGYLPYVELPGGGEGRAQEELLDRVTVRKNFLPVPFYDPTIRVGPEGKTTVRVRLPDNLTDFAIRAKAVSGAGRFGYAKSRISVRLPVIVQPALPRFVRPGDSFVAAAIGRLVSGDPGPGRAVARFEGVELQGDEALDLSWLPQTPRRLEFPVDVPTPRLDAEGRAVATRAKFTVAVERLTDGAADAFEVELPIRDDRRRRLDRQIVELEPGVATTWPALDEPAREGSVRRLLFASDRPSLVRMVAGLDALMSYPYGCTEQRISRERARVALRKLRQAMALDAVMDDEPARLASSLAETQEWIGRAVDSSGLVAYWPGSRGYVHLTAWSLSLLVEAAEAGLEIDQDLRTALIRSLEQALRSDYSHFVTRGAWSERTMALEALSAAGHYDPAYGAELARKAQFLGPGGVSRVLTARHLAGQSTAADVERLVSQLWDALVLRLEHGEEVYGGLQNEALQQPATILPSETRTVAAMLRALRGVEAGTEKEAGRIQVLADALVRLGRGDGWGSTQADATALLALSEYLEPPFENVVPGTLRLAWQDGVNPSVLSLGPDTPAAVLRSTELGEGELAWQPTERSDQVVAARLESSWLPSTPGAEMASERSGFVVERTWLLVDPSSDAPPIRHQLVEQSQLALEVGQVVEEHVRIVNAADRHYVAVMVPLAAGLEVLNPNLATAPPEAKPSGSLTMEPSYADFRDDHVAFYYDSLPKGTYDFYFRARASTEGRFGQPPARAEMMYDMSIWGRSAGAWVEVSRPDDPTE